MSETVFCCDRYAIVRIADCVIVNVYLPCVGYDNRLTLISPVEIGLKLELIGVKLENISYEAEFIPYQHIKSPQKSALGKKFYRGKSKMAAKELRKPMLCCTN